MRRQILALTLGILVAAACGCGGGSGSNADANAQTGTGTATASQVDAPQSGPESGGTATSTGISATATGTGTSATATGTGTGATVTGTGTGTGGTATKTTTGISATATATGTGTSATATATGTGTGGTATRTTTGISATATGTATSATATGTGTGTGATATKTTTAISATATGTGTGATATKTTTAISATATGTGTGTGGTGACNFPSCFSDLVAGCNPGGTCVEQSGYMCGATVCPQPLTSAPTSMFNYLCYSNGVTVSTTSDMTNPTSVTSVQTYKKNGTVCYSVEIPVSAATPNLITEIVKDPAGNTVATYVVNRTARTITVTCTGGSPVVVSMDCLPTSDGGTPCTTGTCTP